MEYEVKIPKSFLKIPSVKNALTNKLFITSKEVFHANNKTCHLENIENDIGNNKAFSIELDDLKLLLKGKTRTIGENIILKIEHDCESYEYGRVFLAYDPNTNTPIKVEKQIPNFAGVFDKECLDKLTPVNNEFLKLREFKKGIKPEVFLRENQLSVKLGDVSILTSDYNTQETAKRSFGIVPESFCLTFDKNKEFLLYYKTHEKIICKQGNKLFASVPFFL